MQEKLTSPSLEAWRGDITSLSCDAIVNAANESLLGGGGVDGAIHRVAGPELLEYCRKLNGCPTGQVKLSPGFKLPSNYILHTVGPIWHGGKSGEPELLKSCYRTCLKLAAEKQLTSVAFPAISTGIYGFPSTHAADIAVRTILEFFQTLTSLKRVVLVAFSETDLDILQKTIAKYSNT
ncbi:MAG: O-acetyl-ADP-ribose deacetylase [Sneathiella sp.]|nr:O-acetyl-ADP-ribose deacetylase [Sneathiella sp.]